MEEKNCFYNMSTSFFFWKYTFWIWSLYFGKKQSYTVVISSELHSFCFWVGSSWVEDYFRLSRQPEWRKQNLTTSQSKDCQWEYFEKKFFCPFIWKGVDLKSRANNLKSNPQSSNKVINITHLSNKLRGYNITLKNWPQPQISSHWLLNCNSDYRILKSFSHHAGWSAFSVNR